MSIFEKINIIQVELKATKDNRNNFGNYNYRSAEDIYNALKPFLKENKLILFFDEKIRIENEREILTSTIEIVDVENPVEKITKSIDVFIAKPKNGNDLTQTTGVSISYARKYLMCGVFTIDNEKDNDAINKHDKEENKNYKTAQKKNEQPTAEEKRENGLKYIAKHKEKYKKVVQKYLLGASVNKEDELTNEQVSELANSLKDLETTNIKKGA